MSDSSTFFEGPNFSNEEDEFDEEDLEEEELVEEGFPNPNAADDAGNRIEGGTARAVLFFAARSIVDDPEAVVVDVAPNRSGMKLELHVAPSDMGRIIGKRGRVAQALRTVVRAAAARDGADASVDIVD